SSPPAKAGVQGERASLNLGSRFRGNDEPNRVRTNRSCSRVQRVLREQLLDGEAAADIALLVGIADERLDRVPVGGDAVRPRIGAPGTALLLEKEDRVGERHMLGVRIVERIALML